VKISKKNIAATLILVVTISIGIFSSEFNFLERFENASWDMRMRIIAKSNPINPKIKIIAIDQSSLNTRAKDGQFWPWPRSLYVPIIKFLEKSEARAIAIDLIFSEHQGSQVEEEKALAQAMSGKIPVISAIVLGKNESISKEELEKLKLKQKEVFQYHIFKGDKEEQYTNITLPVSEIFDVSRGVGSVTASPDSDGIFRHTLPLEMIEEVPVLTLPFALASSVIKLPLESILPKIDQQGRLAVGFSGNAGTYPTYSFEAVLQSFLNIEAGEDPLIPLSTFKDSFVFLGGTAPGILDQRPTALSKVYPGVEFNATVLGNILDQTFIKKSSFEKSIFTIVITATLVITIALFIQSEIIQFVGILLVFVLLLAYSFISGKSGEWTPLVTPLFSTSLALVGSLFARYQLEGRHSRFLKSAFRQYVSPAVIEQIVADPFQLSLGGAKKELTVFFSDIAGFTTISEKLDPTQLVDFLNEYLSEMSSIIMQHNGTIDKYIGDAVVAFWNAPLPLKNHAEMAVKAAIACDNRLNEIRAAIKDKWQIDCHARIGIHTGMAVVGNIGSRQRFNYTVIGDSVNFASRLEGTNKVFGTNILISEVTRKLLPSEIFCRSIGKIVVVGKTESIEIFEPYDVNRDLNSIKQFEEGLNLYRSFKLSEALAIFANITADPVAQAYTEKIKKELSQSQEIWTAIWILKDK